MNPYITMSQARIKPQELEAILRTNSTMTGPALAAFERQRAYQAEAELEWLLKQNLGRPHSSTSLVAMLRRPIGEALIRVGEGLAGTPRIAASPQGAL